LSPRKRRSKKVVSFDDLQEIKEELLKNAKLKGYVDQQDIFNKIADTTENAEILDVLYSELADESVEILSIAEEEEEESEEVKAANAKAAAYIDDVADDSVRLYLREIGKIPLLTAEQEIEIANRVVAGEKKAKDEMA